MSGAGLSALATGLANAWTMPKSVAVARVVDALLIHPGCVTAPGQGPKERLANQGDPARPAPCRTRSRR
jgi:hypothetical protein